MSLTTGTPWSPTVLGFALDLAAKATVILVLGLIVQLVAGRRRAVLGSAAGNACLLGLVLLPFAALLLPPMPLACLAATSPPRPVALSVPMPSDPAANVPTAEPISDAPSIESEVEPVPVAYDRLPRSAPTVREAPARALDRPMDWLAVGIAGYVLVAAALLIRAMASLLAVERLRGSSVPVDDPAWCEALERCRRRLGIGRDVALASSDRLGIPVVLGWMRPTILLPASLSDLDPRDHAEAILLHELSHVRRRDYPWNVLLRLAQALYWPHPLIWLLGRAIAEFREQVCDDICVHELGDTSSYGETLLAVAAGLPNRHAPALGLAMARPSRLGRRLARIARSRGDARCLPRRSARLLIAATAVVAAGLLGAVRLTRAEARASAPTVSPEAPGIEQPAPPRDGSGRVFHLQVVAADTGKPVPNADVRVWIAFRDEWRKADAMGGLDIVHSTGAADRDLGVDVWGDGRAMQRHQWGNDPNKPIPDGEVIKLQPGESLGGIVQDENGQPIRGAAVYLWSHNYKKKDPHELFFDLRAISGPDGRWRTAGVPETTGELLGFHVVHADFLSSRDYRAGEPIPKIADLRAGKAVTVMKKGVPIEGRVVDAEGRPVAGALVLSTEQRWDLHSEPAKFAVTTDAKGHFRTGQVKAGEWFLVARARGHAPGERSVKIGTAVPQVEITLGRPHAFHGRVIDPAGKPVPGAFINVENWRGYRFLGVFLYSDADGRFRWDDAPEDELLVNVDCQGYAGLFQQRISPAGQGVDFTLKPSLSIHGIVRDAENDKRVESARIEFGAIDPKTGEVPIWTGMPELGAGVQVHQGDLNVNFPVEADSYRIRLTADGYAPFLSRAFRREEKVVLGYDIKLVPGKADGAVATVLRPDGKPLAGARVYSTRGNEGLNVSDGTVESPLGSGRDLLTGPDGTFPIPTFGQPFLVLILGDDAYAYVSKKTLSESPRVRAKPYARLEGRYFVGSRAVPGQPLALSGFIQDESTMFCLFSIGRKTTTDGEGRFVFDKVIPIPHLRVARREPFDGTGRVWSIGEPVHLAPGETTRTDIGGKGRPVIGRVAPPDGWTQPVDFTDRAEADLESNRPFTPYPPTLFRGKTTLNDPFWSEWSRKWRETPEGIAYLDSRVSVRVALSPDGSFRFDDLPAGEYRVTVRVNEPDRGRDRGPFAHITREFTVPPISGVRRLDPLDIGTMRLATRTVPKAGDPAPAFAVTSVDGTALDLKDYRGKFLLLDFSVMWEDQSRLDIARLNDIHKRFGEDERFAMLSLVMAADNAETRAFIADKGEPWTQAIVGPLTNAIASAYGIEANSLPGAIPVAVLIGPDGKIIARDLRYNKIGEAIGQALGRAGQ